MMFDPEQNLQIEMHYRDCVKGKKKFGEAYLIIGDTGKIKNGEKYTVFGPSADPDRWVSLIVYSYNRSRKMSNQRTRGH